MNYKVTYHFILLQCNWIEDLLPDSDGILQLFKPDDDAEYNHANHFQIRGGGTKMLPEYTHHLITLGVRQTSQVGFWLLTLSIVDRTTLKKSDC